MNTTTKFEVGKKYYTPDNNPHNKYTCVGFTSSTKRPILSHDNGDWVCSLGESSQKLWKEYKEPVIHKIYLHLMKHNKNGYIECVADTHRPLPPEWFGYTHLGTQKITFEEKPE